jgi:hypothetical protein
MIFSGPLSDRLTASCRPFRHPFPPFPAVSPELAALLRRLKTIYAISGGKVDQNAAKAQDFNAKKSMLIVKLHEFDSVSSDMRSERGAFAGWMALRASARASCRVLIELGVHTEQTGR